MGIDVSLALSLDEKFSKAAIEGAQLEFTERVRALAEPYVPKDTGNLRDSATIPGAHGNDSITYDVDYATYVYEMEGVNFSTPGTQGHWVEAVKERHMDDLEKTAAMLLTGGAI